MKIKEFLNNTNRFRAYRKNLQADKDNPEQRYRSPCVHQKTGKWVKVDIRNPLRYL